VADPSWSPNSQIRNEITVNYCWLPAIGEHMNWRRAVADYSSDTTRDHPYERCARSQQSGVAGWVVDLAWIYANETASQVLSALVHRYALPYRTITYSGGTDLEHIQAGDVVALTDDDLHLTSRVAHVTRKRFPGAGVIEFDLEIFEE